MKGDIKKTKAMQSLFYIACAYYLRRLAEFDTLLFTEQSVEEHMQLLNTRNQIIDAAKEFMELEAFLFFNRDLAWPQFKEIPEMMEYNFENNLTEFHLLNGAN